MGLDRDSGHGDDPTAAHTRQGRGWLRGLGVATFALLVFGGAGCGGEREASRSATGAGDSVNSAVQPKPRRDLEFVNRQAQIEALTDRASIELVFLGDSITQRWQSDGRYTWDNHYAPLHAVNLGINGDRTEHLLWRIEDGNLEGMRPRVVVLLIGTNNTYMNGDEQIVEGVMAIVSQVEGRLPDTQLLLLGILPKSPRNDDGIRARITHINELLAEGAASHGVRFLDVGDELTGPDGEISRQIMPDGLHLSPKGYSFFAKAMAPTLDEMLSR
jgi:lysophospholipase L1-like esterase